MTGTKRIWLEDILNYELGADYVDILVYSEDKDDIVFSLSVNARLTWGDTGWERISSEHTEIKSFRQNEIAFMYVKVTDGKTHLCIQLKDY